MKQPKITKKSSKYIFDVKNMLQVQISEVAIMCRLVGKDISYDEKVAFNKRIQDFNIKYDEHIISGFVGTYGDEFQGIVNNLENGFNILLDIKQELKNFKCRLVIGGIHISARSDINKERSWNIWGDGLPGTRYLLDMNKKPFDVFLPKYEEDGITELFEKMNYNNRHNLCNLKIIDTIKEKFKKIDEEQDLSLYSPLSFI